jgi:hypothetical protein
MTDCEYRRADFRPLAETKYGIGFHWTTWTAPRTGEPRTFDRAVEEFDVGRFVEQAVEAGAGHVLLTTTHAMHWLPGPNPEADRILPGRTCRRDLVMEIADALAERGIILMLYYNHGIHGGDPAWHDAVGARKPDRGEYFEKCNSIVAWMGEHYGRKVAAWWFDHGLADFPDTPWWDVTTAAKAGNPDRLVCYNSGVETHKLHTPFQDYWAGEVCRLNYLPRGPLTPSGLPWYSFTAWHPDLAHYGCGEWGLSMETRDLEWPAPCVDSVAAYLERYLARGGAVTFNLMCYQDGSAYEPDLAVMRGIRKIFR